MEKEAADTASEKGKEKWNTVAAAAVTKWASGKEMTFEMMKQNE